MTTICQVTSNGLLRVGDEVLYELDFPGVGYQAFLPYETGDEHLQRFYKPDKVRWFVREIFTDGSIDLDANRCFFKISLYGMKGFVNAEHLLSKACSWFDNEKLHAVARPYSIEELKRDLHRDITLPGIRLAFYPGGIGKKGFTNVTVMNGDEAYEKAYLKEKNRRFYCYNDGGVMQKDENGVSCVIATREHPVFVTGSQKMFCQLEEDTVHSNYWLLEKGLLFGTEEMEEYLCYIDRNGFLQYELFEKGESTTSHQIRPIVHIGPDAPIDDIYIGVNGDKHICKF